MQKITKIFENKERIKVIPFGDVHYGNVNCDFNRFKEFVKLIGNKKDVYLIGMGDLWDSILPSDVRFDASEKYELFETYYQQIKKILFPIKDKIITLLIGNHEYKLVSQGFMNPVLRLCDELNINYGGYSCFIKLSFKNKKIRWKSYNSKRYIIYCHHGYFGGRKTGSKVNNIEDLSRFYEADIYLVGHSHSLFFTKQIITNFNGQKKITFISTGTFLKTINKDTTSYAERYGYAPCNLGVITIDIFPFKRRRCNNGEERGDIHITE